ncbi:glycosyltransferase [Micromonospora sp. NPDC049230]|uniref:glycosyltransferase n=1 Tax=Micromonospora sp. NPDC049230 TaxID=3155502 RepID=UPI003400407A
MNTPRRRHLRVIFTGVPLLGHLLHQVPTARAFTDQGHAVSVLVPESVTTVFGGEEFEMLPAGADAGVLRAEVLRRTGEDVMAGATLAAQLEAFGNTRIDLSMADSLAAARAWRPDLIVTDPTDVLGPLVATALDVPTATLTVGPEGSPEFQQRLRQQVSGQYESRGLTPRPARWVLDVCPPAMRRDDWQAPERWRPLRPEAHRAPPGQRTPVLRALVGQPRILVTFGTLFTDARRLDPILRALVSTGAALRVPVGLTASADDFDVDPAAVVFEPFVPLHDLLADIDLVVCHGGAGTVLGVLAAGLPMVVVPQGADQSMHAGRAANAGAAVQLRADDVTPEAVARAVDTVLDTPSYRDNAGRIADQIAAMPSPTEVVTALAAELLTGAR